MTDTPSRVPDAPALTDSALANIEQRLRMVLGDVKGGVGSLSTASLLADVNILVKLSREALRSTAPSTRRSLLLDIVRDVAKLRSSAAELAETFRKTAQPRVNAYDNVLGAIASRAKWMDIDIDADIAALRSATPAPGKPAGEQCSKCGARSAEEAGAICKQTRDITDEYSCPGSDLWEPPTAQPAPAAASGAARAVAELEAVRAILIRARADGHHWTRMREHVEQRIAALRSEPTPSPSAPVEPPASAQGGAGLRECSFCNGTGCITTSAQQLPGCPPVYGHAMNACARCGGTGKVGTVLATPQPAVEGEKVSDDAIKLQAAEIARLRDALADAERLRDEAVAKARAERNEDTIRLNEMADAMRKAHEALDKLRAERDRLLAQPNASEREAAIAVAIGQYGNAVMRYHNDTGFSSDIDYARDRLFALMRSPSPQAAGGLAGLRLPPFVLTWLARVDAAFAENSGPHAWDKDIADWIRGGAVDALGHDSRYPEQSDSRASEQAREGDEVLCEYLRACERDGPVGVIARAVDELCKRALATREAGRGATARANTTTKGE